MEDSYRAPNEVVLEYLGFGWNARMYRATSRYWDTRPGKYKLYLRTGADTSMMGYSRIYLSKPEVTEGEIAIAQQMIFQSNGSLMKLMKNIMTLMEIGIFTDMETMGGRYELMSPLGYGVLLRGKTLIINSGQDQYVYRMPSTSVHNYVKRWVTIDQLPLRALLENLSKYEFKGKPIESERHTRFELRFDEKGGFIGHG